MIIDNFIIHENYIVYSKVNIREEQTKAYEKLKLICEAIDELDEAGLNLVKWYNLENILFKLGINYTKVEQ